MVPLPFEPGPHPPDDEREEREVAAHLLDEHLPLGGVAGLQAVAPLGMLVEGEGGVGDEPRHGRRRPQEGEQFDGGDPGLELLPVEVTVRGDPFQRRARGGERPGPGVDDDPLGPALQPNARDPSPEVPGPDPPDGVEEPAEHRRRPGHLAVGQRHPGPGAHRPAEDLRRLVLEDDPGLCLPARYPPAPLLGGERGESFDTVRVGEVQPASACGPDAAPRSRPCTPPAPSRVLFMRGGVAVSAG